MLEVHQSYRRDKQVTIFRYMVAIPLLLSALGLWGVSLYKGGAEQFFAGLLNGGVLLAIAYGSFTQPHKYSAFAVLLFFMLSIFAGPYEYRYLTEPIEGRESLFSSLTEWWIVYSMVLLTFLASVCLYLRSRKLYVRMLKYDEVPSVE